MLLLVVVVAALVELALVLLCELLELDSP